MYFEWLINYADQNFFEPIKIHDLLNLHSWAHTLHRCTMPYANINLTVACMCLNVLAHVNITRSSDSISI